MLRGPPLRRASLLALLPALAAGCGGDGAEEPAGDGQAPVPDSVYVEVMARLTVLDSLMGDPSLARSVGVSPDSARRGVLARWGVDADELLEFARTRGGRPEQMQAIWERIGELSDSLHEAGWTPPPDGAPPGDAAPAGGEGPADGTPEPPPDPGRDTAAAGGVP